MSRSATHDAAASARLAARGAFWHQLGAAPVWFGVGVWASLFVLVTE